MKKISSYYESLFVELNPLVATGVLLEVHRQGDRYVLVETAPATGNQLLRFSSKDKGLVYAAFAKERGLRVKDAEGQADGQE